jgi:WD40 repeat protein
VQLSVVSEVPVSGIALSPDGQIGAVGGSWENIIRLVRVSDGAQLPILEGHTEAIENLAFSPDGTLLASVSDDKTIRLWGVAEGP